MKIVRLKITRESFTRFIIREPVFLEKNKKTLVILQKLSKMKSFPIVPFNVVC